MDKKIPKSSFEGKPYKSKRLNYSSFLSPSTSTPDTKFHLRAKNQIKTAQTSQDNKIGAFCKEIIGTKKNGNKVILPSLRMKNTSVQDDLKILETFDNKIKMGKTAASFVTSDPKPQKLNLLN